MLVNSIAPAAINIRGERRRQAVEDDFNTLADGGTALLPFAPIEDKFFQLQRLGRFLDLARNGRLKPQPHFLVEDLDRFSRLAPRRAYRVFDELLELGVTIVDLSSGKRYGTDSLSTFDLMEVLLRFERSNEESQRKSDALKEAWAEKRRNAGTVPLGATCPG